MIGCSGRPTTCCETLLRAANDCIPGMVCSRRGLWTPTQFSVEKTKSVWSCSGVQNLARIWTLSDRAGRTLLHKLKLWAAPKAPPFRLRSVMRCSRGTFQQQSDPNSKSEHPDSEYIFWTPNICFILLSLPGEGVGTFWCHKWILSRRSSWHHEDQNLQTKTLNP